MSPPLGLLLDSSLLLPFVMSYSHPHRVVQFDDVHTILFSIYYSFLVICQPLYILLDVFPFCPFGDMAYTFSIVWLTNKFVLSSPVRLVVTW